MKNFFLANVAILIFLAPPQILNLASDSAIQRTVEAAAPWFQIAAASPTILKEVSKFLAKKNKTGNSNDN
jgi:hypothetical protein